MTFAVNTTFLLRERMQLTRKMNRISTMIALLFVKIHSLVYMNPTCIPVPSLKSEIKRDHTFFPLS